MKNSLLILNWRPITFLCIDLKITAKVIAKHLQSVLGCALFPEFLQNFSERQILWSLCSIVFHALTLKLPIQTLLYVAPTYTVFWCTTLSRDKRQITVVFEIHVDTWVYSKDDTMAHAHRLVVIS